MGDPVSLSINAALLAANMAMTASQQIEGPRLDDLSVTTADYGTALNYLYGVRRFDGVSCIWAEPLKEVKRRRKTKGGKFNDYTYFGTFAVLVADQPCAAVLKILFDRNVVYDTSGAGPVSPFGDGDSITNYMRIYLGTEDQDPDPRMQATIEAALGPGFCPAYRGCTYIVFEDLPLEKIGNRLPQVSVVAATAGSAVYPFETLPVPLPQPNRLWGFAWSSDYSRFIYGYSGQYTIIDDAARAVMISGDFPASTATLPPRSFGIDSVGRIYVPDDYGTGGIRVFSSDGLFLIETISTADMAVGPSSVTIKQLNADSPEFLGAMTNYPLTQVGWMNLISLVMTTVETADFITGGVLTTGFFVDQDGALWGCGAHHALVGTVTTAYLFPLSSGTTPGIGMVTVMGLSAKAEPNVQAFQVGDNYLLTWDIELYLVDATGAILASQTGLSLDNYNLPKQVEALKPGATTLWVNQGGGSNAYEIDLTDLSIARTVDLTAWTGAGDVDGMVYDPINNALICAPEDDQVLVWRYLDRAEGTGVLLSDIIEDVATRSGLPAGDIDASACTQTVTGYSWTQGQGAQILEPLLEAYDSLSRPHDFKLEFRPRGDTSLGTIPRDDFVGGYVLTKMGDGDLPLSVNLTFADTATDQQANAATAQRDAGAADTSRQVSLDASTLALGADEARQIATGLLRRKWIEGETLTVSLTRAYSKMEPGDVYSWTLDDVSRKARIDRLVFGGDGKLNLDLIRDGAAVHVATALPGAPADGIGAGAVVVAGYTKGLVLDIPLVRDADDDLVVYLAASPYSPATPWPGADFLRGDDGTTFDDTLGSVASSERASIGYATTVLPDALATVVDYGSSVTVKMFDGTLTSCTLLDALNGANAAQMGDERIAFITATLVDTATYQLSGLLRGRRGTEWATGGHASGDAFVLLAGVPDAEMGASDVGDTLYYKPVTNGGSAGFVQVQTFTGASLKPYAPAHIEAVDASGDIDLSWVRRTRIGADNVYGSTPPLGETSEAYEVDILNGGGTVIRTLTGLSSPSAVYTAAQQATDSNAGASARAYQISSVVGRGYPATVSL